MAQAKGRKRTRKEFAAMMDELFPVEMFAEWSVHGNALWTPRNVVWVSLIMCSLPGQTLQERFTAARKIMKYLQPGWTLPTSQHECVNAQMSRYSEGRRSGWRWPSGSGRMSRSVRHGESPAGLCWRSMARGLSARVRRPMSVT